MVFDKADLPTSVVERAEMLANVLVDRATGGEEDEVAYRTLRQEFIDDPQTRPLLPQFIRTHRRLSSFWHYIKTAAPTYAERRTLIYEGFAQLIEYLETRDSAPIDEIASKAFMSAAGGVSTVWTKALDRRDSDPEGAITLARTLLEAVIKHVLDECGEPYTDKEDLPKLYRGAAKALNLAPDQHAEEAIRAILGGAMNLVNGIGTLRNRLSDSHSRGKRRPVKPSPRHAKLAVNTAGAMAMFLIETLDERALE